MEKLAAQVLRQDNVPVGSAVIVGRSHLLTAAHVTDRLPVSDGARRGKVRWRSHGTQREASVAETWRMADGGDAALLLAHGRLVNRLDTVALLCGESLEQSNWGAWGYPQVQAKQPLDLSHEGGTVLSWQVGDHLNLSLHAACGPEVWSGLSGSGVFVGRRLVGIVHAEPGGYDGEKLEAVPIARFLHEAEFRRSLGLPDVEEQFALNRQTITEALARLLSTSEGERLAVALAPRLGAEPATLVTRLFEHTGAEIARALLAVARGTPSLLRLCRMVGARLLPAAIDLQARQREQLERLQKGQMLLVAPFDERRLCDIFLAGLKGRPAHLFADVEETAGFTRPSVFDAPVLPRSKHFVQAVAQHIVRRDGYGGGLPDDEATLLEWAREAMAVHREGEVGQRFHTYLRLDHRQSPRDAEALRDAFPSLWIVQTTTDLSPMAVFLPLRQLYGWPDPPPEDD